MAFSRPVIAIGALVLAAAVPALANPFERVRPVTHEPTRKECGECHMAFQPGLLPAGSWTRIMDGLNDHFGESAALAPDAAADIRAYLTGNAAVQGDGGLLRITEQPWWARKHRRLRPDAWTCPGVVSKANCEACHRDAAQGLYEDD